MIINDIGCIITMSYFVLSYFILIGLFIITIKMFSD